MTTVGLGLPSIRPAKVAQQQRPDNHYLIDRHGRRATDLRVSLTDRCNLRCRYCMPADGLNWLSRIELLTTPELVRLVALAVRELGVTEVRFTGGEPLIRPDLTSIIAVTADLPERPSTSITTNGVGLADRASELAAAGLDRANVSLDSIRAETFRRITRRDHLAKVLHGLRVARAAGLNPIKVNAVPIRGLNEDQTEELLRFCIDNGYQLRFIEQMPLDAGGTWRRENLVTAQEIVDRLSRSHSLTPAPNDRGSSPAQEWLVDGGPETVGIIAAVTRPFCGDCDRTRLTADGQIRSCLFASEETDLRRPIRAGASDADLAKLWREAMWNKAAGHTMNSSEFVPPARSMSAIGG